MLFNILNVFTLTSLLLSKKQTKKRIKTSVYSNQQMAKWWINSFNSVKLEADPRASSRFVSFLFKCCHITLSLQRGNTRFHHCKSFILSECCHILLKKSIYSVKFETWTAVFLRISLAAVEHGYYCDVMCILALLSSGRPITCIISLALGNTELSQRPQG